MERRFGLHLGDIEVVGPRRAFPLGLFIARSFVAERIALVGDAAHVIHPIAGQGLNMGLRDVAALAEAIVDAARLGLDIGGADVLERYQRWRRFDTMTMGVATDGLNRLFSNHSDVLRLVRDIGLGVVDRMPALKRSSSARPRASPAKCRSCFAETCCNCRPGRENETRDPYSAVVLKSCGVWVPAFAGTTKLFLFHQHQFVQLRLGFAH